MHPKNLQYLNNKRKFGESDAIVPVSDIKVIGDESRKIVYHMITLSILFGFNLTRSIQQIIRSNSDDIIDSLFVVGFTAVFGIVLCLRFFQYRRCESCRFDLESMIINIQTNKNT